MRKTQILMNKPVYLGLSILDRNKTAMHIFVYDYLKPKYDKNAKICCMDTGSFMVHVKSNDIYNNIVENVKTRFDTSNFELDRPLPKGLIGLMEDVLGGKIMIYFVVLRAKTYSYLNNNNGEDKKAKGTKILP